MNRDAGRLINRRHKHRHSQGQTAVEFLVTYGWALLVIAVVMLALFATGIFNQNNYASQECIISSGFSCISLFAGSDGTLLVNIQQSMTAPINITAIGCDQNSMVTGINMLTFNTANTQIFLPIGANFTTVLQCYNNQGTAFSGTVGGTFSGYIVINYTNDFTHIPETAIGSISSKMSSPSLLYACTTTLSTVSTTATSTTSTLSSTSSTSTTATTTAAALQYMYCVGTGNSPNTQVYYAPISSTGVGMWASGSNYPIAMWKAGCSISGGYIYCVGSASSAATYYAAISSTGFGAWASGTSSSYPTSFSASGCSMSGTYLYCLSSLSYYAPVSSTGFGTWISTTTYPSVGGGYEVCAIDAGWIYCMGSNTDPYNQAYYAPVFAAGGIGTWIPTNSYPTSLINREEGCSIYGGYLYCIDATGGAVHYSYYAPVSTTGIGPWSFITSAYPVQMQNAGCSINSGYIYCVGSSYSPFNLAYYAPVSSTGVGAWTNVNAANYPTGMYQAYCEIPGTGGGYYGGGGSLATTISTSTTTSTSTIPALMLDGYADFSDNGLSSASTKLTTTNGNDVIIVYASTDKAGSSADLVTSVTASGLSFTQRTNGAAQNYQSGYGQTYYLSEWYAIAANPLSSVTITATAASAAWQMELIAFAVAGANTISSSPFDTNTVLPANEIATGGTTTITVTASTNNAPDMIVGGFESDWLAASWNGPGYTIAGPDAINSISSMEDLAVEYKTVSAPQYGLGVVFYQTSADPLNLGMADAIQAYATTTSTSVTTTSTIASLSYIYCVGGSGGSQVYYAPISSTGVGAWAQGVSNYPVSIYYQGCSIGTNNYIYCVGSEVSPQTQVYYAPISSTGFGTWTANPAPFPAVVQGGCSAYNNYLYCMDDQAGQSELSYYAPMSSTGVGPWTYTTQVPEAMGNNGCSINNGYIYCLGTSSSPNLFYYAPVSSTGIGTFTSTGYAYAGGASQPSCSIYNNIMYCVGSPVSPYSAVYYAPVSSTGMGAWTASTSNPSWETLGCAISSGVIYCVGSIATPYNEVYYAPISNTGVGTWTSGPAFPHAFELMGCDIPGFGGGYWSGGGPVVYTPATTGYFVNVIVTDAYASATPSPFQQMLTINSLAYQSYINPNWNNIEFTTGPAATGSVVQAWVETNPSNTATNTLVWVNLPNGVPANGNTIIYMNFMSSNVMSSSGPTGEAPQYGCSNPTNPPACSGVYGLYDNGALVFPSFYDNFAGTTVNPAWDVSGASGDYSTTNELYLNAAPITGCAFTLNALYAGPLVVDTYQYAVPYTVNSQMGSTFSNWQTFTSPCNVISGAVQQIWNYNALSTGGAPAMQKMRYPNDGGIAANIVATVNTNIKQVTSLAVSSTNGIAYENYNNVLSQAATYNIMSGNIYPGITVSGSVAVRVNWFRIRAFPPGNVMPSVTYGPITH